MDANIIGIVLFLIAQLLANIAVIAHHNTRITRIETHLIHVLKKLHYEPRKEQLDELEDFEAN